MQAELAGEYSSAAAGRVEGGENGVAVDGVVT